MPRADSVTTPSARSSDDGLSPSGRRRYGDIALDVPLLNSASPVTVEVRVWQDVGDDRSIYIGARVSTGSWDTLGMIRLPLDDGLSPWGRYRYGDISLDAPLPRQRVVSLAGLAGVNGYLDGRGDGARFGQRSGTSMGLAVDHDGSVLVADFDNVALRRILPDGTVTTIAGRNRRGSRDGPVETAQFEGPTDMAIDPQGGIYVADCPAQRIRKITADGMVTTVAGGDHPEDRPWVRRDGRGDQARFLSPCAQPVEQGVHRSPLARRRGLGCSGRGQCLHARARRGRRGTVFYATSRGSATSIRKMGADGAVSTVFEGRPGIYGGAFSGSLTGLALAPDGMLYVADRQYGQVVRISPDGEAAIVVGPDSFNDSPHFDPAAILITPEGDLLVADSGMSVIWKITLPSEEEGD